LDGIERCIDDEIPFDIPDSWCWARFSSVITIATNLVEPAEFASYPHIAPDNIEKGTGRLLGYRTVQEDKVNSKNHLFSKGQILYSKIRPALQKAVIAPCAGLCSADMYPLESVLDMRYLLCFILSEYFTQEVLKDDTRVKMPKTNKESLSKILVPVPPKFEQIRISDRVQMLIHLLTTI